MKRRDFLLTAVAISVTAGCSADAASEDTITVYQSPA